MFVGGSVAEALVELKDLTERLRRECPWDREQTAKTIVPHTVEEAYEVADAALAGDDVKLLDEIGDLLFQTYFLSLLLEERGAGSLEQAARGVHAKLVARHPHVFGDAEAETAGRVRQPGLLQARKVQRRAAAVGFEYPDVAGALADLQDELRELLAELPATDPVPETEPAPRVAAELGDVLFACVNVARKLNVDPELELRAATHRFRVRVETAERLAAADDKNWVELSLAEQDDYFDRAKEME
jgi:uncharacterized protein YabN with tetrapyrrole methylase and pyrophosphatase domain